MNTQTEQIIAAFEQFLAATPAFTLTEASSVSLAEEMLRQNLDGTAAGSYALAWDAILQKRRANTRARFVTESPTPKSPELPVAPAPADPLDIAARNIIAAHGGLHGFVPYYEKLRAETFGKKVTHDLAFARAYEIAEAERTASFAVPAPVPVPMPVRFQTPQELGIYSYGQTSHNEGPIVPIKVEPIVHRNEWLSGAKTEAEAHEARNRQIRAARVRKMK